MEEVNDKLPKKNVHSEKVRRLLKEKPPVSVRWGTTVVSVIFIILLLSAVCLTYPYSHGESIGVHIFEVVRNHLSRLTA